MTEEKDLLLVKGKAGEETKNSELEEYRLLRTEILQYLEEYQTVRNMMYAITGVLLGLGVGTDKSYLLLLPLLVIKGWDVSFRCLA